MLNPPLLLRRPDVQTSSKKEPPLQEDPGRFGRLWRMSHIFRIFLGIAALRGHCHHIVHEGTPPLKYSSWARAWRAQGHTYINGGADARQEFFFVTNCHHTG